MANMKEQQAAASAKRKEYVKGLLAKKKDHGEIALALATKYNMTVGSAKQWLYTNFPLNSKRHQKASRSRLKKDGTLKKPNKRPKMKKGATPSTTKRTSGKTSTKKTSSTKKPVKAAAKPKTPDANHAILGKTALLKKPKPAKKAPSFREQAMAEAGAPKAKSAAHARPAGPKAPAAGEDGFIYPASGD